MNVETCLWATDVHASTVRWTCKASISEHGEAKSKARTSMLDWQLECIGMFVPTDMNDHGCIALQHVQSKCCKCSKVQIV